MNKTSYLEISKKNMNETKVKIDNCNVKLKEEKVDDYIENCKDTKIICILEELRNFCDDFIISNSMKS